MLGTFARRRQVHRNRYPSSEHRRLPTRTEWQLASSSVRAGRRIKEQTSPGVSGYRWYGMAIHHLALQHVDEPTRHAEHRNTSDSAVSVIR
jgi:hypothetical protein